MSEPVAERPETTAETRIRWTLEYLAEWEASGYLANWWLVAQNVSGLLHGDAVPEEERPIVADHIASYTELLDLLRVALDLIPDGTFHASLPAMKRAVYARTLDKYPMKPADQDGNDAAGELSRLRNYLSEIAKGSGPFSRDELTHADNCINAMKDLANKALRGEPWEDD